MGTRVMVEAAKTAGVPTFLHTSSIAAVGYSADGVPIDETSPYNFANLHLLYNDSKREAEGEALDGERYGLRVVIVNPGVLYGPRSQTHPFGHTMLELAADRIPGHPTGGISVTDVHDAALGMVAALERGRSGERYLLTGHNITYRELLRAPGPRGRRQVPRKAPSRIRSDRRGSPFRGALEIHWRRTTPHHRQRENRRLADVLHQRQSRA